MNPAFSRLLRSRSRASSLLQGPCLLRDSAASKTGRDLPQNRWRAEISVGAAEGCESVAAFAAFGSSYNIIRATPAIIAVDLLLILILGAPSNHAGRKPTLRRRANRQGCRFSRAGPWMALRGGPPNQCRITGMPSLGEGPSGGARAFCLLLRFSKVRRRKGATLSSRYRRNGYVHNITLYPALSCSPDQAPLLQKSRSRIKPWLPPAASC